MFEELQPGRRIRVRSIDREGMIVASADRLEGVERSVRLDEPYQGLHGYIVNVFI